VECVVLRLESAMCEELFEEGTLGVVCARVRVRV
jgi:hypothetical protein